MRSSDPKKTGTRGNKTARRDVITDLRTRLAGKLRRNRASLLTENELKLIEAEARRIMGPHYAALFADKVISFRSMLRWSSLGAKCQEARSRRRLSVREVAAAAGIPQYRVRAIEQGSLREVVPQLAEQYFRFLGIESWVRRWATANPELASQAGVVLRKKKSRQRVSKRGWAI